eukprot:jgi/Pico_ML_1/50763/g1915.t1
MENKGVQDVDLENAPAVMKQTKDMRSIRLADLPESVAEELKMLDVDESGTLSTSEIVESVRMYRESRRQYGIAMKIIIALCIFALIQIAAIVGTVWALLVKVKDTDTNDVDGQTTLTKSGSDDLIHTGLATKIYSLRSDLPDSVLEQADHIRLTSPTGNDASFKVAAHFRIGEKERPILKVVLQDVGMVSVDGGSSNPKWESLMTYTREMNCYPFKCDSYNIGKENFDNLPADAIFYGRGMKQLTYVSNYLLAGVGLLGYDNYRTILETPDLLADSFEMILATGLDFYKRVQPPKPSMQEVILGWYKPNTPNVIAGTEVTADGSLLDKFMASISIINGGIECSPRTENECLSLTDAQVAAIAGDTNIDDKQATPIANAVPIPDAAPIPDASPIANTTTSINWMLPM